MSYLFIFIELYFQRKKAFFLEFYLSGNRRAQYKLYDMDRRIEEDNI